MARPFPVQMLPPAIRPATSAAKAASCPSPELPPNALRRRADPSWRGGFSMGVDLGGARTGLALSKGFVPRPLTVLELRGQRLELRLLEIADKQEVDEFIFGLPKSVDGKETVQSNKVRSIAGRFAVRAAERGWRVYVQDEHGTSAEALECMINGGLGKSARQCKVDAYAATMILERYFESLGSVAELILPKDIALQENLRHHFSKDTDLYGWEERHQLHGNGILRRNTEIENPAFLLQKGNYFACPRHNLCLD